jgi:uncharacterized protein YbaR (Trm112 family)
MGIANELLSILVCPRTGKKLSEASGKKLDGLLRQVKSQELAPSGDVDWTADEVTSLLLTEDRKGAYPVIDGVAVLLPGSYLIISS